MTLTSGSLSVRPRSERIRGPLLGAFTVTAASLALHLRDPHVGHSWGICPLYALTGLYCPGCGGLRGVNDLTNGHIVQATSSNLLLVLAVPFAALCFARWSHGAWTGRDIRAVPELPKSVTTALVVLAVAFTLARNLPGSWLAP
jgi:Protein of unknown function (DUF2752)